MTSDISTLALPTQEVPYRNGERHAQGDRHIMQVGGDIMQTAPFADDLLAASSEGICAPKGPLDVKTENRSCKSRFSG
jgi:hypothetical protein